MSATFRPNSAGYRELLKSDQLASGVQPFANRIAGRARAGARVKTGDFRSSIHTEVVDHPSRKVVQVVADCEGADAIEARDRTLGTAAG